MPHDKLAYLYINFTKTKSRCLFSTMTKSPGVVVDLWPSLNAAFATFTSMYIALCLLKFGLAWPMLDDDAAKFNSQFSNLF